MIPSSARKTKMAASRQLLALRRTLPLAASRGYATAAAAKSAQPIKAPIQLFGIEGRYAHALFAVAAKQNSVEKVEKELADYQKLVTENQKLAEFIGNPTLNKRQKEGALRDVLKAKKFSDVTINLFATLAENSRLNKSQGVVKAYMTIMSAYRGEVPCTVTTATPMNAEMKKQLENTLQVFLEKNQVLKLDIQQDPEILGGMVVDLGDKFIDMSTRTRVQKIIKTISEGL